MERGDGGLPERSGKRSGPPMSLHVLDTHILTGSFAFAVAAADFAPWPGAARPGLVRAGQCPGHAGRMDPLAGKLEARPTLWRGCVDRRNREEARPTSHPPPRRPPAKKGCGENGGYDSVIWIEE